MDRYSTPRNNRTHAPWLRNRRWSSGSIQDQSAENLHLLWIFTILWNVVTALILIPHVKSAIHSHDYLWLLALPFPAAGLALLICAALRTRRITKFGASVLRLQIFPASPRGDLAGTIHVAQKLPPKSTIQLQLICIVRFVAGFGRNATVVDRVVWRQSQTLDRLPDCPNGTVIPVLFHIPPDAKPSSDLYLGDGFRWRLEAHCKTSGVPYYSRFDVPVFVVPDSQPAANRRDLALSAHSAQPTDPRANLIERGIIVEQIPGGRLRILFAGARNKSPLIRTTVIGLALTASAFVFANWPASGVPRAILVSYALSTLLVGGAFDLLALYNWLLIDEITVRYGSLTTERRAPLFHEQQTFKIADVSDLFPTIKGGAPSPSDSASKKRKRLYGLMLKTRRGEQVCLANDIIQKDYAAWLADEIKNTFGVVPAK